MASSYLLKTDGFRIILASGTGDLLLNVQPAPTPTPAPASPVPTVASVSVHGILTPQAGTGWSREEAERWIARLKREPVLKEFEEEPERSAEDGIEFDIWSI